MAQYKGAAAEGVRANQLIKKRQKEQEELEVRKKKIEEDLKIGSISNKFAAHFDAIEQKLKTDTVGLVSLEEMRAKQDSVIKARETQMAVDERASHLDDESRREKKRKNKKGKVASTLSFNIEGDDEGAEENNSKEDTVVKRKRLGMNPDVDTSFLPDRDREEADAKIREKLRMDWEEKQAKIRSEEIEITYSYWDGSGHRRSIKMRKGNSMQQFLQMALEKLRKEFNELKLASVDQLMYVKEDLMIPHHYTFYDFIVTKARGKSGPLFSFDVHDDVRIISDANVEKDESHAGKVCLRSWYERNKHIFPASRWEPYNPEKKWDGYSVSDKEAAKIIVK